MLQILSWLILPIFDSHTRVQHLQARMAPSDGWVDLSFLRLRPVSRVDVISFCRRATLLFTAVFQHDLSFTVVFQVLKSMLHLVKLLLHVFLYLSFGLPLDLFPCASSPKRSCFGILLSSMRLTCPSYFSLLLQRFAVMFGRFARARSSVLVTLPCQLIPIILRRQRRWNTFSLSPVLNTASRSLSHRGGYSVCILRIF